MQTFVNPDVHSEVQSVHCKSYLMFVFSLSTKLNTEIVAMCNKKTFPRNKLVVSPNRIQNTQITFFNYNLTRHAPSLNYFQQRCFTEN